MMLRPTAQTLERAREPFDDATALLRFKTIVGTDFGAALHELARLRDEADVEDDDHRQQALDVFREQARDHVLALPIRRLEDAAVKAEIAVRHCHWGDELQKVLVEIAAFGSPGRADRIVPAELF